jgi:hypothetical protein
VSPSTTPYAAPSPFANLTNFIVFCPCLSFGVRFGFHARQILDIPIPINNGTLARTDLEPKHVTPVTAVCSRSYVNFTNRPDSTTLDFSESGCLQGRLQNRLKSRLKNRENRIV